MKETVNVRILNYSVAQRAFYTRPLLAFGRLTTVDLKVSSGLYIIDHRESTSPVVKLAELHPLV